MDVPATLTALGSLAPLVAAIGALVAVVIGYLNRRAMAAARERAEDAARAAERAKSAAEQTNARLIVVEGTIRSVGEAIDGRLSELLKSETGRARAEGIAAGEQAQRDRSAPPESAK